MPPDVLDFLFEHFKEAYKFQLERIDKLRDRATFGVAILSVLASVLVFFAGYPYAWHDAWSLFFYIPAGLSVLFFLSSVGLVLWAVGWWFRYSFIPGTPAVQNFADQMVTWSTATVGPAGPVVQEIKEQLLARYRDGAHHNFRVNRRRTDLLIIATRLAALGLVFAFAAAPRYYLDKSHEDKPTKVLLVGETERKTTAMATSDNTQAKPAAQSAPSPSQSAKPPAQSAPPPSQSAKPANQAPSKPTLPPNQLLSEGSTKNLPKFTPSPKGDGKQ